MSKLIRNTKLISIVVAVLITALGFGTMFLVTKVKMKVVEATDMTLPSAGMSGLIEKYTKVTGDSSIDCLSTTALMTGLEKYNEYYDKKGSIIGRTIIYVGDTEAYIFSKPTGYARIERNEEEGIPVGVIKKNAVATLISRQKDNWYQIVSGGVSGYIKSDGFLTGKEAEKLDKETYATLGYANISNAYVYSQPDIYSDFIYCMPDGIGFEMLGNEGEFTKINIPNLGEGWVNTEDIVIKTTRKSALSTEQENDTNKKIADGRTLALAIQQNELDEALAAELEAALAAERRRAYEKAMENYDGGVAGQAIVDFAAQFVGWLPYVYGGTSLEEGADCSGFVYAVYQACGYDISRSISGQMYDGGIQVPLDEIMPGDIISYGSHVGIYAGDGMIIHQSVPGENCNYASIDMMPVCAAARYAY